MKMKKSLVALAFGAAFVALPAAAQWNSPLWSQAYVGAGGGRSDVENADDRENSWKVFAGVAINQIVGAEVAYNDFGTYGDTDVTAWSLAATAQVLLDPNWFLMAKLGATQNKVDGGGADDDSTELLAGVGVGFRFDKNVALRLEYEHFGDLPFPNNDLKLQNLSLSLTYAFP
jgi:opacity protein-like surface antigen